jgi:hypothetical protein
LALVVALAVALGSGAGLVWENLHLGNRASMCRLCPGGTSGVRRRHRKRIRKHAGTERG